MELLALVLVLGGSVLHLGWNALTKQSQDQFAFLWIALIPPACFAIFLLSTRNYTLESHLYFATTGIIHAIYFYTLANSYRYADLSFVYPYARGIGTMVATFGGIILLNERPSYIGYLGIGLTLIGTLFEPLYVWKTKKQYWEFKAILFTALTGVMIGTYLVLDTKGVRTVDHSYEYISMMFIYSVILLSPWALKNKRAKKEWKISGRKILLGSFFMSSAYAVILLVMQSSPVSYTVAARASGIILSAVYGKMILSENISLARVVSVGFVLIGVGCLAYA